MQINKKIIHPILLIRHAQSIQNQKKKQILNSLPTQQQSNLSKLPKYLQMKHSQQLLDAQLSKLGIQQCYQTKQKLKYCNIDIVIVSPLRRALQTCDIIFGERKDIKVYVQPLLAQALHAACDIGSQIQQSIKKYSYKFNFSKLGQEKWNSWYLQNISNKKILQEIFRQQNTNIHKNVLKIMKQNNGLESNEQVRNRCILLKEQIKNYIKQSKTGIAIVGHYFILRFLTCKNYDEQILPIDGIQLWNGQSTQYNFPL